MNLFIQKNAKYSFKEFIHSKKLDYSFKENIHSSEKWIIAQGYRDVPMMSLKEP